jgi:VWFA-related protein
MHPGCRRGTCALVMAGALIAMSPAARVQQQQPRYIERVDVARLIVDARVVDELGEPVLGLGPDDFTVKIAGKSVRVESAMWVGGHETPFELEPLDSAPPAQGPQAQSVGRLVVFVFQKDLHRSRITGLMQMLIRARGFLDRLAPHDHVAILSFDSHLKVWIDFSNDVERLRPVLERGILFERPPREVQQAFPVSLIARLDPAAGRRAYTIERGLRLIAEALTPLPGAKSLVLVGHGFGRFSLSGVTMENEYDETVKALTASRTAVFSLDVTQADYHSLEAGLQLVSEQTGGFFARTHIFPERAMRSLAGALAGYYALFVEKPEAPAGQQPIDVQLTRRKGTVLTHRSTPGI